MDAFKRSIEIGRLDTGYKAKAIVTIKIEWDGKRLSISGDATRRGPGDRMDQAGQMVDSVETMDDLFIPASERDELVAVWRRWHLNDMRAGCEHQRQAEWDKQLIDPTKPSRTYGRHFSGQKQDSWNLLGWVRPDEHPDGLLGKPCRVCGYKYGTGWQYEDVPEVVLDWLRTVGQEVTV